MSEPVDDGLDAAVAEAERAEVEAAALATALEQRFLDGDDDVSPAQIEKQKSLSAVAKLQAERERRRADRVREAKRLGGLEALRSEIDGYVAGSGKQLAADLQAFLDARTKLLEDAAAHDALLTGWTDRAHALNAPQVPSSLQTQQFPQQIALGRPGIENLVVGARRLRRIEGGSFLTNVLNGIAGGYDPQLYVQQLRAIDDDESA